MQTIDLLDEITNRNRDVEDFKQFVHKGRLIYIEDKSRLEHYTMDHFFILYLKLRKSIPNQVFILKNKQKLRETMEEMGMMI
jgi:hypothetical protein